MKRLALLAGLVLPAVAGNLTPALAYYLDAPHNESNGIYCATCHNSPAFKAPEPVGNIDDTRRNAVCLQCHTETPTSDFMPFKGPAKKLHASSSINSGKFGQWTTECTQCHDVHYQGQLDWADDSDIYLATGTVAADNLPYNSVTRSTTVTIDTPAANPEGSGWDNTANWMTKGGRIDPAAAVDNTRGLIFVPDRNNPETYEIIGATPTSVTVKGKMTATAGAPYGVIYGQSIKSFVLPNGGSKVSDLRAVRFYRPEVVTNTFGGYVDETAGSTKPAGLCQVCHTSALMQWKKTGEAQTHHVGEICGTCHDALKGFTPAKNHAPFIVNPGVNGCACHASKLANPESAHTAGCPVCHADPKPEINTNAMLTEAAGTVRANLLSSGYSGGTAAARLKDGAGKGINDAGFTPLSCGSCHLGKPDLVGALAHGLGHADATFRWGGNCADCHSGTNIVTDVHSNNCLLCHVSDSGGARKVGDPSHGVDGHADLETAASTCLDCHDDHSKGTIHHQSKNSYAASGNCGHCHKVSSTGGTQVGNHTGDHTSRVGGQDNCSGCHIANIGSIDGAPVDPASNKVHDACTTCHTVSGTLKTHTAADDPETPATVVAMTQSGDCVSCHGAYFSSHDINHATKVAANTGCSSSGCHENTPGTDTGITVDSNDNLVHDACTTCHDASSGSLTGLAAGHPGGGDCLTCHLTGHDTDLAHNHRVTTGLVSDCTTCHAAGSPAAVDTLHTACATCHAYAGGILDPAVVAATINSGRGVGGAEKDKNCETCHTTGHNSTVDHDKRQKVAACALCHAVDSAADIDLLHKNNCLTCHGYAGNKLDVDTVAAAIVTGRGADGTPVDCRTCHTINLHHLTREAANNDCAITCHQAVDHSLVVAGAEACVSCHTGTAGTAAGLPLSLSDAAIHDACRTCHTFDPATKRGILVNYTNKKGVNGAANTPMPGGNGDCTNCHLATVITDISAYHHTSPQAKVGQCEACHVDPRPSWGPNAPGDNGTSSGLTQARPTQMACRKCHVAFAGGTMTVYKYTRSYYGTYTDAWTQTTAHTITGMSKSQINNYGICLNCHYTGSSKVPASAELAIWHAFSKASWYLNSEGWSDSGIYKFDGGSGTTYARGINGGDQAHYVPGRSSSGIAGFNIFAPNFGVQSGHRPQQYNISKKSPTVYGAPVGETFTRIALPQPVGDQLGASSISSYSRAVPVFASLAPQTATSSSATDNVKVKGAIYSGGNLTVVASTSNATGCSTLTASYGVTNVVMSGAAASTCTATITNPDYPAKGTTVNVSTSNALGLDVTGYPITDQNPGTFSFSANTYSVAENGGTATITVRRTGGSSGTVSADPVTVNYATSDGTASTAGGDYTAKSGTLSWAAGDMTDRTFAISISNDSATEGNETVNLTLSLPTNGATPGLPSTAQLTIADNDQPAVGTLAFDSSTYTVTENGGSVTITVTRTGGSAGEAQVHYATNSFGSTATAGSDYDTVSGNLTFADGVTSQSFTVSTRNSGYNRGNTTINLYLDAPTNGALLGAKKTAVITVISPAVAVLDAWPSTTPQLTATTGDISGPFSIGSGSNRLLLVAVSCIDAAGSTGQTFSATYGGKPLTEATTQNLQNGQTWIGYLKEDLISTRTGDTLAVTISGTHSAAAASIASYSNVNQVRPLAASSSSFWSPGAALSLDYQYDTYYSYYKTAKIAGADLLLGAGGYAVYNWTNPPDAGMNRNSDAEKYTEHLDTSLSTANIGVASKFFSWKAATNPTVTWYDNAVTPGGAVSAITLNSHAGITAIAFSAPTYSVEENGVTATITATRLGSAAGAVSVTCATSNGTAVAGTDYEAKTATLAWPDGIMTDQTFSITIYNNSVNAANKTVNLALSSPTGGAVIGLRNSAVLTIVNDDAAIVFGSATYSVDENGGSATITVNRTGALQSTAGATCQTADGTGVAGTHYTFTSVPLTWDVNDTTSRTCMIPILDNGVFGGDKTVNLELSALTGAAVPGSPSTAVLTIVDDEPSISFSAATYSQKENGGSATVTVNRKGSSIGAASIDYTISDGTARIVDGDYTATPLSGTLTWADGETTAQNIPITIVNDSISEDNETVTITLTNPTGAPELGIPSTAELTIVDDDHHGVLAFSAPTYSVNENIPDRKLAISVTRTGGSDGAVGVSYGYNATGTTANYCGACDFYSATGTLAWADGDADAKTYELTIGSDTIWEGTETVNLMLSDPPTGGAALGVQSTAVLSITDPEDQPGTLALTSSTFTVDEDAGQATITVTRSGGYNGAVSVSYQTYAGGTAVAGADYTAVSPTTLSWAHLETGSKSFAIPIINNAGDAASKTVFLKITAPGGSATLGSPNTAVLTIVPNEAKAGAIAFTSSSWSVAEGDNQDVEVTITATRTGGSDGTAQVSYATEPMGSTATPGLDYLATSGTLTWAEGEYGSQSFTVTVKYDSLAEGDETINLRLFNPIGASLGTPDTAILTIEGPGVAILDPWPTIPQANVNGGSSSQQFSVGAGHNRLLVVAISSRSTSATGHSFSVTYDGKPLTQAAIQNSTTRQTWIGYLKEADIAASTGKTVSITVTGGVTYLGGYIASYQNVDQINPIGDSGGTAFKDGITNYAAVISPAPLTVGTGGYALYNWSRAGTRTSDDEGYTEHGEYAGSNLYVGIASKDFASAALTQPKVTWGSGAIATSVSFITLNKYADPVDLDCDGVEDAGSPVYHPPTDLAVTPLSETQLNVFWKDTLPGENGYRVERKAESCSADTVIFEPLTTTYYNDDFSNGIDSTTWLPGANLAQPDHGAAEVSGENGAVRFQTSASYYDGSVMYNQAYMDLNVYPRIIGDKDFDVQFDYSLPNGDSNDLWRSFIRLTIMFPLTDGNRNDFWIARLNGAYRLVMFVNGVKEGISLATTDTFGKLRLVRSNRQLSGYVWNSTDERWQLLGRHSQAMKADLVPTVFSLQQHALYNVVAHETTALVDNFQLNTVGGLPVAKLNLALDEASWNGTAGEVKDRAVDGNHGKAIGGVTTAFDSERGMVGKFDGSVDDYVEIAGVGTLQDVTDKSYTFAAWAKPTAVPLATDNVTYNDHAGTILGRPGWHTNLFYSSEMKFKMYIWNDSNQWFLATDNTTTYDPATRKWHHLVGVVDDVAKTLTLYVDRVKKSTVTYTGNLRDFGTTSYTVGATGGAMYAYPFTGLISDARVFDRALTAAEVETLYDNSRTFQDRNLAAATTYCYRVYPFKDSRSCWLNHSVTGETQTLSSETGKVTVAGQATAVGPAAAAGTIYVNMPFTSDNNGNSTYTVEYKLHSSGTWTTHVAAAGYVVSPYTTTISGLAQDVYDVRVTYDDADGVSGAGQQTIDAIMVY